MNMSNIRFQPFSSFCVVGPTGSGKTHWVFCLLKHLDHVFEGISPSSVLYCYGASTPSGGHGGGARRN